VINEAVELAKSLQLGEVARKFINGLLDKANEGTGSRQEEGVEAH
jgi:transcription termination factor NusB